MRSRSCVCLAVMLLGSPSWGGASPVEAGTNAKSEGVATPWLARVQEHIAQREYNASGSRAGLQAPNRRHNLRTYFEPTGVRVHDRTASGNPVLAAMRLHTIGPEGTRSPVLKGVVRHAANRVEIVREGLTEWYVNSEAGVEQGFTLAKRPDGEGDLQLDLALSSATATPRGDGVALRTPTGRVLQYDHLMVNDASGATLPARLEVPDPHRIRIVVSDAEAAYPLTIDPLITETADAQLESDQASAQLGASVSSAGDVNGDGYADVIVGAHDYDAGETDEGAAFVFLGSAAGIADSGSSTAHAQLESDQMSARFGASVSSAGDVNGDGYGDVIVGAHLYDAGEVDEGAAFLFLGSATGIGDGDPTTAHAQLESDQLSAGFGVSVSSAGDVNGDGYGDVIVGSDLYDAGLPDEGAAFVFLGSAAGIADSDPSTAHAQLESDQLSAGFGASVSSAGEVNGDGYGDVIVGAHLFDAGQADEGAAFLFLGSATGIADGDPTTADARMESNQGSANLGHSVATAGDVNGDGYSDVIVGARGYDAGEADEGAAFVYLGGATGLADGDPGTADAQLDSDQADVSFGRSVASAGDVNGDGYSDVIVGARRYDAGEAYEGAAFVFLGSATGIGDGNPGIAHAQLESDQAGANFGVSVSSAGDVNGDGYGDVIVGASRYTAGEADEGAAFVFLGSAAGIASGDPSTAHAQLESDQANASFGVSVSSAGDVNGDGHGDVIVGANLYDAGEADEGAAFVFLGSPAGVASGDPTTAHAQLESDQVDAWLGVSVASAGDVNGDGYSDVIVGAQGFDAGEMDEGAAFVFHGSASGISDATPTTADAQLESDRAVFPFGPWFELSVASAGDVNGDGYSDVIVGAPLYSPEGAVGGGKAFVFLGSAAGIADGNPGTAHAQLESNQTVPSWLGVSVASAGDVNGDGYADVIVGARQFYGGESFEGAAFVFLGSATGVASGDQSTAHAQFESNQTNAYFGESVASAGDVDGDGFADVIVGAFQYDAVQTDDGAAFVFLGGDEARPSLARQRRGDGSGIPVQPWGASGAADAFAVELTATHPQGRGRVKLEVEHCPAGAAFGDGACGSVTSAGWTEIVPPMTSVVLSETVSGLAYDTLYRWRARVLHAPATVTEPGITPPPNPAHGPWRRTSAQAVEADIRVVPEPGALLSLGTGAALLALLKRRRERGLR